MPLNPSIIASVGQGFNTPFENLKLMRDQQADQALTEERKARADALKRAADEEGQVRQIWEQYGSSVPDALARTYRVSPETAAKIEQQYSAARQNWAQESKAKIAAERAETERSAALMNIARGNQDVFDAIKPVIAKRDPDMAPILEKITDANSPMLGQLLEYADTAKNIFDRRDKATEHLMSGDFYRGAAGMLATATTPEEKAEMVKGMAPHLLPGQAEQLMAMSLQDLERASLDTKEAKTLQETGRHNLATEGQTALSQGQTREEQARHNKVLEGQGAARVGIARQRAATQAASEDEDATEIAGAIIRGEQPPETTGLYGKTSKVRAELARRGYKQADAISDWRATQKHLATLNGAQQTRMAQAIDNADHSLDVIDELAKKWDAGRFPILNSAQLRLAKGGAFGKDAQQIATQLDAQIADVTSELANVYMGGNSPTDHALSLAAKNLSADWSKDQLRSMITQSKGNLKIRSNSMRNVGVAGVGENTYAPQQAAPPPVRRRFDKTGKEIK